MNNYLMLNNRRINLTAKQAEEVKRSLGIGLVQLKDIKAGEIAKINDLEFIVFEHKDHDTTLVLLKNIWKTAEFDGATNNYAKSKVREKLNKDFYNTLSGMIGSENIVKHTVDLAADDGRTDYDSCEDFISLLICQMYRRYVYIIDKYRLNSLWWTATAYSTKSNGYDFSVRCVNNNGTLNNYNCNNELGVRPFWEKVRKSKLFAEIRTLLTKEHITFLLSIIQKSIYDRL